MCDKTPYLIAERQWSTTNDLGDYFQKSRLAARFVQEETFQQGGYGVAASGLSGRWPRRGPFSETVGGKWTETVS